MIESSVTCINGNKQYVNIGIDIKGALKKIEAQRNAVVIELMPQGKVVYIECKDELLLPKLKEIAENIAREG